MFIKITGGILYDDDFEYVLENWSELCNEDDYIFYPAAYNKVYDIYITKGINPIPNMIRLMSHFSHPYAIKSAVDECFVLFCKDKNIDHLVPLL